MDDRISPKEIENLEERIASFGPDVNLLSVNYLTRNQYLVCRPVRSSVFSEISTEIETTVGNQLQQIDSLFTPTANKTIDREEWNAVALDMKLCGDVASFDRAGWQERAESGPTSKPGIFSVVDGNSDGKID